MDKTCSDFEYRGYTCRVKHIDADEMAWFCGYVLDDNGFSDLDIDDLEVHGGITYSDDKMIGFDCSHAGDYTYKAESNFSNMFPNDFNKTIWTEDMVTDELMNLVDQIIIKRS